MLNHPLYPRLPTFRIVFEVEEVIDGKLVRWYATTLEGDPNIHRISDYGAKVYARREMSLSDVVRECPEPPFLEGFIEKD